jgi:hypothetical protein
MKTQNRMKRRGAGALKKEFLKHIGVRTTNAAALQGVVKRLIERGVSRDILVTWGVHAGYPRTNVSSMLSRILCAIGLRERRPGAGRKPSPDALELLAHARARYNERFLRVLQGALRAGKAQMKAQLRNFAPQSGQATELITPSQLRSHGANCEGAIKGNGTAAALSKVSFPRAAGTIFKTNVNPTKKV